MVHVSELLWQQVLMKMLSASYLWWKVNEDKSDRLLLVTLPRRHGKLRQTFSVCFTFFTDNLQFTYRIILFHSCWLGFSSLRAMCCDESLLSHLEMYNHSPYFFRQLWVLNYSFCLFVTVCSLMWFCALISAPALMTVRCFRIAVKQRWISLCATWHAFCYHNHLSASFFCASFVFVWSGFPLLPTGSMDLITRGSLTVEPAPPYRLFSNLTVYCHVDKCEWG